MGDQFALKNNQVFVLAEAAGGVYNSDQLRILCEVADNESAFLKITEDQRIGFMVDPDKLADVQAHVRKSGLLLRSYKSSGVPSPRACLGELCTFAHQPSLGDALELTTHLLKSFPAPKRYSTIGINGCQRACLGSSTEDIHVVAEEAGYKISIGGKGSDIPQQAQLILENVTRADLPIVIEKILAVFYQESQENERIVDVIERIGLSPFFNALPEHLAPIVSEPAPSAASLEELSGATNSLPDSMETPIENTAAALSIEESSPPTSETTTEALDDLLDSTAAELSLPAESTTDVITDSPVAGNDLAAESDLNATAALLDEPAVDIIATGLDANNMDSDLADLASDGLGAELLEVADGDLEEGSLEDVERVRDAIRTELSMTPTAEQTLRPQSADLLDELNSDADTSAVTNGFDDILLEDRPTHLDDSAMSAADDLSLMATDLDPIDTAANIEHQKPSSNHQTFASPSPRRQQAPLSGSQKVGGRLSIRFEGDQLAVELPSGLSFELPFESVSEGGELTMSLPDGELRIARDGQMLAVGLGMLNMKIPIPNFDELRVA